MPEPNGLRRFSLRSNRPPHENVLKNASRLSPQTTVSTEMESKNNGEGF